MLLRWMRKMLVLALAALGIQYTRMILRVVIAELRPRPVPLIATERSESRGIPTGSYGPTVPKLAPQRLVITTLEPQGVL